MPALARRDSLNVSSTHCTDPEPGTRVPDPPRSTMRDVLRTLIEALEECREQIFCQVVETKGSTPQRAGAVMVVDPAGGQTGTLGGGCVENEVKQHAIRQLGDVGTTLRAFVLDHDYAWADGLICGGKMVIAIEALRGQGPLPYFRSLHRLLEAGEGFTEAVIVNPERIEAEGEAEGIAAGRRFLFGPDGVCKASWPAGPVPARIAARVVPLQDRPRPEVRGGVAWIASLPRVRLVIVGAGHVGQAVASLAAGTDFDVWVIDDRNQYANPERFPTAQQILVGPIEEVLASLEVTPHTYALIVTRGHGHDQEALYHLAPTPAPYVGLIGSRRKIKLIFESLRDAGIAEADLARVAAPVGLDIGSQTVPEIAISIVAELIARRSLGHQGPGAPARCREHVMSSITIPAIVPAAGKSRRMGRPKPLLPFDGQPLIGRVVSALRLGGASPVLVVTPPAQAAEGPPIAEAARQAGAAVITPAHWPAEMRESAEIAIEQLGRDGPPSGFILAPGDSPGITPEIVGRLLERSAQAPGSIVIPRAAGRRTHPIVLPWDLARQIPTLPRHQGINALMTAHPERVIEIEVPHPELADELNTPEDLERWQRRLRSVLTIRLFAVARERAGRAEIEIDLPLPATVADLRLVLALQHPKLAALAPSVSIAVDSEYATDATLILPGAQVALIPPVSGG